MTWCIVEEFLGEIRLINSISLFFPTKMVLTQLVFSKLSDDNGTYNNNNNKANSLVINLAYFKLQT